MQSRSAASLADGSGGSGGGTTGSAALGWIGRSDLARGIGCRQSGNRIHIFLEPDIAPLLDVLAEQQPLRAQGFFLSVAAAPGVFMAQGLAF